MVDDDRDMCAYLALALGRLGHQVTWRTSGAEAFELLREAPHDVLVTDLNMRGLDGLALCERVVANHPDVPVIVITAFGSLDTAVAAIRAGAYDFVTKPFEIEVLDLALRRAHRQRTLEVEVKRLRERLDPPGGFEGLLGQSPAMRRLFHAIEQVAQVDSSILLRGETGTGKELVVRAIHGRSRRAARPFVAVNCAAVPEALLESEMFGHVRGAFSGAVADREGLFARADGGTLFLDEVGDMPLAVQAKLLRALQDRRFRPVGATEEREVDVRLLAATHRDLEEAVAEGRFREDLFFRLNVIALDLPPLRARGGDVLLLAQAFLARHAARAGKRVRGLTPPAAARLLAYSWPGNVRELENALERAVVLTTHEELIVEDLPEVVRSYQEGRLVLAADDPGQRPTLEEVERRYVEQILAECQGNKTLAAKVLGLDRKTLYRKLERFERGGEERA